MTDVPFLDSPDTIRAAMARVAHTAPFLLPLLDATLAGRIGAVFVHDRTWHLPTRQIAACRLPVLLLIGDDDGASTGPAGWRCAGDAAAWAFAAVVHGAAGEPRHYAAVAEATVELRRLLFIETASPHVLAWGAQLAGTPTLAVAPPDGRPHPVLPAPGDVH